MKIAVDAGCLGITDERLKVGVYVVVKNLLEQLGKIDTEDQYYLYSFYPIDKTIMQSFGPWMQNKIVKPTKGWMKLWLPLQLLRDKPDVFLGLNQALPKQVPFGHQYKKVVLFYDLAYEKFPDMYPGSLKKLQKQSVFAAKHADTIIAISQQTKIDIQQYYRVPEEKITVAYPGVDPIFFQKHTKYISEHPYFLFVGALKKMKNIPTLIKAFVYFSEHTVQPYNLILAGGDKWFDSEIETVLNAVPESIKQRIKFLHFIDYETLRSLYKGAEAFVSPSFYEGFGLPVVEAMASGCPVIVSNKGSLPEVVGYSGLLFDPKDVRGIADAMIKIANDKTVRQTLSEKGKKRASEFSWETFAKKVHECIQVISPNESK